MPMKKLKPLRSCEKYKQTAITDYFRNSSRLRRKLLFTDTSKIALHKGKLIDIDTDDDSSAGNKAMSLPYPMSSDDEETGSLNEIWINSNKISINHSKHDERPTASSTPKINSSSVTSIPSTSQSKNVNILEDIRLTPKENKKSFGKAGGSNRTLPTIELNKPSTSNSNRRGIASSTPSKMNSSSVTQEFGDNVSHIKNVSKLRDELNHEEAFEPTYGNTQYYEETLTIPCKRMRMDNSLSENENLKVQLDIRATVVGDNIQQTLTSQEKLHNKQIVLEDSPGPSRRKPIASKTSSANIRSRKSKITPSKRNATIRTPNKLKAETKNTKLNIAKLEFCKKLFQETLGSESKKQLPEEVIEVVEEFMKMDANYQLLLMSLFLCPIWHNMRSFCKEINLDQKLSRVEITTMYESLKKCRFVDTDLTILGKDELLEALSMKKLRKVAVELKIERKKVKTKATMIAHLNEKCRTQLSEDVLKVTALRHLGDCIKLREDIKSSFYKVYVLKTYSNFSYCMDIQNFWIDAVDDRVVYPKYTIENNYTPFRNKEQFSSFFEAIEMHKVLEHSLKNKADVAVKSLCDDAFKKLRSVNDDGKWRRYDPDHLHKFSSEYLYISLLNSGIINLSHPYFEDVKIWLEFLIKKYETYHLKGFWVKQLAVITIRHKKYDSAAKIVIDAFEFNNNKKIFDEIQLYDLNKLADKLINTKMYEVCTKYKDRLYELSEQAVDVNNFQTIHIDKWTDKIGLKGKRISKDLNEKVKLNNGTIDGIALGCHSDNEEFQVTNCERIFEILFTLFFWDLIYDYYVPLTFISKLQVAPLDMDSDSFYKNRQEEIDLRLQEIADGWSENKLETFLKDNWNNHAHEKSITDFGKLEVKDILKMCCIDRKVLSKILGRIVTNYELYRSGFPDRFIWNATLSKYKFVMTQVERQLEPKKIMWLKYLMDIGAEVEVRYVSVGAMKSAGDYKVKEHILKSNGSEKND